MTITGADGSQDVTLDFSFNGQSGIQCQVAPLKVTSTGSAYSFECTYLSHAKY